MWRRKEQDLTQLQAEREALQVMVDAQEIRPEDADRMNAEKDQLAQQISAVQIKAEEVSKLVWDREIGVQKRMDQLEKLVQDYNTLYYRLSSMDPALTTSDIKFELEVNVHAAKAELATNVDLRGKIKV